MRHTRVHARRSGSASLSGALLLAWPLAVSAQQVGAERPLAGFSPAAAVHQLQLEERIAGLLENDSTGRHFRYLTEEPHVAGSPRNKELADYVASRFRGYGLEDVQTHRYDVLLPYPEEVLVTMLEPFRYEPSLTEDGYPQDKDSYDADVGITYLGMSGSGDVTGHLIYANSGNPADYDWLERQGIEVAGKVAIVRYSVPYSYRGFKALTAEQRGVKALIIYSDPADDGYRKGLTYPQGPWGPESHIQRGAITYDFMVPGDPLTPGWASVEGARRISVADAQSVPGIIAVPMSYRDARPLLQNLGGPVAPLEWQGGLPFTYRVGPGATRVRVKVQMDGKTRPIWVVEGRIRGAIEPDKMVVLGNHRDAWVYGAVDPSSGTATQLELARVLGTLLREGHRPRRTIVLASWDAEEWHLTGSTEWGEQFSDALQNGAIAYLNVDGSTAGSQFEVGAVASLNRLIVETVRDVGDPNSQRSILQAWTRGRMHDRAEAVIGGGAARDKAGAGSRDPIDFVDNKLGSGSDYTVFLNFLGIPIIGMSFDGPYGVYHSQYDNFYWMTHFGDPGFRYMTTMAEIWGRMALRLANAEVYPFDFGLYARRIGEFLDELAVEPGVAQHLELTAVREAQRAWAAAATHLAERVALALASDPRGRSALGYEDRLTALNEALRRVEQELLLAGGIPGRPWFKHVLYAPKFTYAAMEFPGVREAVDRGDWARAREQLRLLTERLHAVGGAVGRAGEELPSAAAVGN